MDEQPQNLAIELVQAIYALAESNMHLKETLAQTNEIIAYIASRQGGNEIPPIIRTIFNNIFSRK